MEEKTATSIAQRVNQLLKENPDIKNSDLYSKFPPVSQNTLRNYKSRFKKTLAQENRSTHKTRSGKKSYILRKASETPDKNPG